MVLSSLKMHQKDFIKGYNDKSDEEFFFEFDVQYLKKLHDLHNDPAFYLNK